MGLNFAIVGITIDFERNRNPYSWEWHSVSPINLLVHSLSSGDRLLKLSGV